MSQHLLAALPHSSRVHVQAVTKHQELLQRKQKELAEFMSAYKIQVKNQGDDDGVKQAGDAQGLLVS